MTIGTPPATQDTNQAATTAIEDDIRQALSLTNNGQYSAALPIWDKVIDQLPNSPEARYERTRCYLHLAVDQRIETEYIATMQLALTDMNQALSLDPGKGDYYKERGVIYYNLAQLELYRVDQDYWNQLALADNQAALRYNTTDTYVDRSIAYSLVDAGFPQEALEMFSRLPFVPGDTLETDPGIQVGLAESYFGLGKADEALTHIDLALKASPSAYKKRDRVLILLSLGRLSEALDQINETIADDQFDCGCRYYTRALIYYEQGHPDLAQADIDFGAGQTWERGGLRSYVLARLALDNGDQATGLELLQEAEASLPRRYGLVILQQIQADLANLGAPRLAPTPYAPLVASPMPTPN